MVYEATIKAYPNFWTRARTEGTGNCQILQDVQSIERLAAEIQNRHAIVFFALCGESVSVNFTTVEEWENRFLLNMDNVYNADETG